MRRPCFALNLPSHGEARKGLLASIALLLLLAGLAFALSNPSAPQAPQNLNDDRQQTAAAISHAESLRLSWQQVQSQLTTAFAEVQTAPDADQGLDRFVSARNASIKDLDDLLSFATTAIVKLEEKKAYFSDPHVQSLLPPEVLPELDEALRHQVQDLKALQAEVHTTQTQLLPDIHSRLKRLHAACDLKAQISGEASARELWQSDAARIATLTAAEPAQ